METIEKSLIRYLQRLADAGITDLPRPASKQMEQLTGWVSKSVNVADSAQDCVRETIESTAGEARNKLFAEDVEDRYGNQVDNPASALAIVEAEVANCTQCAELAAKRTHTVFGVGNPNARLCFLGEGPGADEDRRGEPFVGKAGQLLDRIIEACQMNRADVYILNTVKCRPPGNRNPAEQELENCWNFAQRQLEIIQPEFIVCLGSVAATTLLNTKQSISRLRQQFHQYRGSRVIVTYHPAYLLRNPSAKRQVWDDMKMLLDEMGIQLPG